jgi:hypothetical protein
MYAMYVCMLCYVCDNKKNLRELRVVHQQLRLVIADDTRTLAGETSDCLVGSVLCVTSPYYS